MRLMSRWEWVIPEPVTINWSNAETLTLTPLPLTYVTVAHRYLDVHQFMISWQGTEHGGGERTLTVTEEICLWLPVPMELQTIPLAIDEELSKHEQQYRRDMDRWRTDVKYTHSFYPPPLPVRELDCPAVILVLDEDRQFCVYYRAHPDSKPVKIKRAI